MDDLRFPEWQKPYQDALLEANPEKLSEKITAAETAISAISPRDFKKWGKKGGRPRKK